MTSSRKKTGPLEGMSFRTKKTGTIDPQRLERAIDDILPSITRIRHTIHQNPEIALKEFDTASLVRKTLKSAGISPMKPFLQTDVVAVLKGKGQGKNVTLRADMDALPFQEKTGLPYASKERRSHACLRP